MAKNHLGETEYQTYAGWRAACKKVFPGVVFEGDKDVCEAFTPFTATRRAIGQWEGDKGSIYKNASLPPSQL